MRARARRTAVTMAAICALLAGCGQSLPIEPEVTEPTGVTKVVDVRERPPDPEGRGLIYPPDGASVAQNVSSLGCPAHPYRGFGFALRFDWADDSDDGDARTYELLVKARTAEYAVLDLELFDSEFDATFCNAFVIDRNLTGWEWKVTARARDGSVVWSEMREFRFEPCRHPGNTPCSAPVGS